MHVHVHVYMYMYSLVHVGLNDIVHVEYMYEFQ